VADSGASFATSARGADSIVDDDAPDISLICSEGIGAGLTGGSVMDCALEALDISIVDDVDATTHDTGRSGSPGARATTSAQIAPELFV
jgi:hypothetical protein